MKKLLALLFIAGLFPVLAHASGYALYEMNAAAHAQAHAYIARVKDPSAVWYNPAALTRIEGTELYASSTWISTSGDFVNLAGNKTDQVGGDFFPTNIYMAHQLTDKLVLGAGFYQPFGLTTEWPANSLSSYVSQKATLHTFFITPSVAYKISKYISVGGGLDIVLADAKLERNVSLQPTLPFTFASAIEGNKTKASFNLGLLMETDYNVNIAVTYKHKTDLDFDADATFINVPAPVRPLFPDGPVSITVPLPSQFMVGLSSTYDKFSFEGDIIWTQWDAFDALRLDFTNNTPALHDQETLRAYENTYAIRLGAEYMWNDQIALRGGYYYDKTPVPNKAVDPILPDGSRNGITLGMGYIADRWTFDVGYLILLTDDRTSPPNNFVTPPGNLIAAGTYTNAASLLSFGFGYKF